MLSTRRCVSRRVKLLCLLAAPALFAGVGSIPAQAASDRGPISREAVMLVPSLSTDNALRFGTQQWMVKDSVGNSYASATGFVGGEQKTSYAAVYDIPGTVVDEVYRTQWVGASAWSKSVVNGWYRVTLKMREAYFSAPGQRVFNVDAEGVRALSGIDIYQAVGKGRAYDRSFTAQVLDGRLNLAFSALANLPLVSAIVVEPIAAPSETTIAPTPTPVPTLTLNPAGQIVPKSGDTISGLRIQNPSGPCVYIPRGVTNVTIAGNDIGPCGSDVTGVGIEVQPGAANIVMRDNRIHGVASGAFVTGAQHPIVFERNIVTDVRGPMPRGQMVQFDSVRGGSGQSRIVGNTSDKLAATAATKYEDHINVHASDGFPGVPILVACNKIRGGDSTSGSGIMVGDNGGSWIDVANNTVVQTPNTGLGVAGGSNINIRGNRLYNAGSTSSSQTQTSLFVMGMGGSTASSITISGNRAIARAWLSGGGGTWGGYWTDGSAVNLSEYGNSWGDLTLTSDAWNTPPTACG